MTDEIAISEEIQKFEHGEALASFLDPNAPEPEQEQEFSFSLDSLALGFAGVKEDAKVWFRGGWTCTCVSISLPWVELDMKLRGLIKNNIDIYQLGYRNDVAASAGVHAKGGNTDVGQDSVAEIAVWRNWGWAMQARTRAQGFDTAHGHGWPWGCTHLSAGGKHQANQWANGTNGLASFGPIRGKYPIPTWKEAIERNVEKLFTVEDIARKVVGMDGLVENVFTGNPTNKTVALGTALKYLGENDKAQDARLRAIEAKLDKVLAALAK